MAKRKHTKRQANCNTVISSKLVIVVRTDCRGIEAYRYDRASFSDRHGYYYGYFDRRGYMFEGEFYRYDRFYSYRDRMRGKELFGHRYYRPVINYYSYNNYDGYDNRY